HEDFRQILAAEDSSDIDALESFLFGSEAAAAPSRSFQLDSAFQGQEALAMVQRAVAADRPYAVCFLDMRMPPGWDGTETLRHLWGADPDLQVVLCTAYSDYSWNELVERCGDTDQLLILKKPFEVPEVRQLAHALSEKWRLARVQARRLTDLEVLVAERTEALRREMTERARAEHELYQAQRLKALGRLAAGIGHEINNPLTFILGSVEAAQETLVGIEPQIDADVYRELGRFLEAAAIGSDRIAQIVRSIKMFVRPDQTALETVDVAAAVRLALDMIAIDVAAHIAIDTDLAAVPPVLGKRVELEQLVINLLKNAVQALAGQRDREARVRVSCRRDGERVIIEIADTGTGIAQGDLDKIFEPFFTTKPVGQGTGLGLSICHAIVTGMGGTIDVRSAEQNGTTVTVGLPAIGVPPAAPAAAEQPRLAHISSDVRGRILLVDDEPFVLQMMMHALREHDVVGVSSGREAIARCLAEPFDLVFCDLMMPEITGMELYQMIRQERPALAERMVFVTGGALLDGVREFLDEVPNEHLEKPVERRRLQAFADQFLRRWQ
ncbi:MAG TPA: ATP-binding protein, partial [Haliangium sp.]|nr:ATP-binding protein [Haliangium sp.]